MHVVQSCMELDQLIIRAIVPSIEVQRYFPHFQDYTLPFPPSPTWDVEEIRVGPFVILWNVQGSDCVYVLLFNFHCFVVFLFNLFLPFTRSLNRCNDCTMSLTKLSNNRLYKCDYFDLGHLAELYFQK